MIYILLLTFIHITYNYIVGIENHCEISLDHIVGIENYFELSLNQLIFGAMDNKENIDEESKKKLLYQSFIVIHRIHQLIFLLVITLQIYH